MAMQTVQITLLYSLLSPLLSQTLSRGKYIRIGAAPGLQTTRAGAKNACGSGGLATILSVTDNHQARHACNPAGFNPNGCWIGLKGTNCAGGTPACDNYAWDDDSPLTNYGFTSGVEEINIIINAYTSPDGPWDLASLNPDTISGESCVWTDGELNPTDNNEENEIWELGQCVQLRGVLCNRVTPEVQLFCYNMMDATGAGEWDKSSRGSFYELPLATNAERCKYANDDAALPVPVLPIPEASTVLQACWAIKNPGTPGTPDHDPLHLSHLQSTEGFENCVLQFNIDPYNSIGGEACIVTYTTNAGGNWHPFDDPGTTGVDGEFGSGDTIDTNTMFLDIPRPFGDNQPLFGVRFTLNRNLVSVSRRNSVECYFNNVYLWCDRAPTTSPTRAPSNHPTTGNPTRAPTNNPTRAPTNNPTRTPTNPTPAQCQTANDCCFSCPGGDYCCGHCHEGICYPRHRRLIMKYNETNETKSRKFKKYN